LYVNNTPNYILKEELELGLTGCHIEGVYGNYLQLTILPGKE